MLFLLSDFGLEIVDDVESADIVIVNTCAFITPSKEEALSNIFEMCTRKEKGRLEKVVVSGCLSQRHKNELCKQIPEVDAFLTASENLKICEIVEVLPILKLRKGAVMFVLIAPFLASKEDIKVLPWKKFWKKQNIWQKMV